MELLADDFVTKVVVKKRKSDVSSGSGLVLGMGPSIPPATKEHANCQVGLRKGICDNQYYLSIKTNKNRQIGKDIIITFNEDLSTRRVTLTGETTIQVIPDRLHSQKKDKRSML